MLSYDINCLSLTHHMIETDVFYYAFRFHARSGLFRTLTRDRRTLKGVHALGLLRMNALVFGWILQFLPGDWQAAGVARGRK